MINASKDDGLQIIGSTSEVLNDLTNIIHGAWVIFEREYGDDLARDMVAFCGRIAFDVIDGEEVNADIFTDELIEIMGGES